MRSNLLSLQNIARQQDIVQNRLATGLKVSSAIDNPSSYYTAASLSNRAADLSALLDAMSQGVQTIKTASEAIDSATSFLEQAKATANQALESATPAKAWFEKQVGENGAVVTTAQELRDAVNAGKETICVYGKIELENTTIRLKDNQKLVGTEYFTGTSGRNADGSRFSQIIIDDYRNAANSGIELANGSLVADLKVSYTYSLLSLNGTIKAEGVKAVIRNVDVESAAHENYDLRNNSSTIIATKGGEITLEGDINIAARSLTIYAVTGSTIKSTANISITTKEYRDYSIYMDNSKFEASGSLRTNNGGGMLLYENSSFSNIGKFDYVVQTGVAFVTSHTASTINLNKDFRLYASQTYILQTTSSAYLNIESGAIFSKNGIGSWTATKDISLDVNHGMAITDFNSMDGFSKGEALLAPNLQKENTPYEKNLYALILEQFDMLISDASYKGVNLLRGQNLKINFNENRSTMIEVPGYDVDSESLGLKTKEWNSQTDIENSISELESAINSLRSFSSAFGNYYSIVTTRQDFTENLINVLEEGADKLTLADMNEESANMLALQTSQQLAVNSLSLASQAAQSVLKLF